MRKLPHELKLLRAWPLCMIASSSAAEYGKLIRELAAAAAVLAAAAAAVLAAAAETSMVMMLLWRVPKTFHTESWLATRSQEKRK